jgi:outer membrane lipoprotein LolB
MRRHLPTWRWRALWTAAAALLLGACALQRPGPAAGIDWAERDERVGALAEWSVRGRIAIKSTRGGGQGDLHWRQQGDSSVIRVSGPFGAGAYEIRWDAASLTVRSRNGEFSRDYTGADAAEQFLTEQLGWAFPAVSTRRWLLALPDPGSPAVQIRGAAGELAALEQNGWNVTYERYADVAGLPMPARFTVQNADARLRLVIDRWCLGPDCS